MITRFAMFEGRVKPGETASFRDAVLSELLPLWQAFPGALAVRVSFSDARDEGAPEFPLILAIDYPDLATVEKALESPVRAQSRAVTQSVVARFFEGRIHHHVTECHALSLS
ncbi:hypothetical protein NAC44_10030 [Allorhizobium sp. BGMRC 0089]|uniref:hypothetical protein n=1 Tax=Allorhizobium sonneratiae TaxID=2934936 RepID=UPI002033DF2B|nr:hypothetical protein [Allorhizobium sonneratiae]MCM2292658.1 hypothetical protein [Allorhizobium sonneratiae]